MADFVILRPTKRFLQSTTAICVMNIKLAHNMAPSIVMSIDQQREIRGPEDDWSGKTDPAKRRKIQNRLHQRAWRKRQAMRRKLELLGEGADAETQKAANPASMEPLSSVGWVGLGDVDRTEQSLTRFANYANERYLEGSPRTDLLLTLIKFNVFRALMTNDQNLSLGSTWLHCDAISPFYRSSDSISEALQGLPANLRPIELQLCVEHHPWIDLLPDPTLRNNILLLGDEYDDGPLCHDVVDNRHGEQSESLIVWGDPCNIASWEIGEDFYRKWAFILKGCHDLFRATNYWRGIRGERRLFIKELDDP